jgi:eukaryotic-like serine/threonine-protein kinase
VSNNPRKPENVASCVAQQALGPDTLGVVEDSPATDRTGASLRTLIGRRFVVERVIGEGSTGVVVAAHHKDLGTKVAVKLGRTTERESAEKFLRDAHAMKSLESPYTVRIFDVGETPEGLPWMVMEHLDGHDLGTMLVERGQLVIDDALRWMLQVAEALTEAHDAGILHRDVKPSNLFLARASLGTSAPPSIRVLDFGFSPREQSTGLLERLDEDEVRRVAPGDVAGTSFFMAPEQVRGTKVDARTDVWGFGACLFRLLGNRYPFTGVNLPEVVRSILGDAPAKLSPFLPDLPGSVDALIHRCLQKEPRDRFQNIAAVATALRGARDDLRSTPIVVAVGKKTGLAVRDSAPATPIVSREMLLHDLRETPRGGMESVPSSSSETMTVVKAAHEALREAVSEGFDTAPGNRLAPPSLAHGADAVTMDAEHAVATKLLRRGSSPETTRLPSPAAPAAPAGVFEAAPDTTVTIARHPISSAPITVLRGPPADDAVMTKPLGDRPAPLPFPFTSPFAAMAAAVSPSAPSSTPDGARSVPLAQLVESVPLRIRSPGEVAKRQVHRPETSHVSPTRNPLEPPPYTPPLLEPELESERVPAPPPPPLADRMRDLPPTLFSPVQPLAPTRAPLPRRAPDAMLGFSEARALEPEVPSAAHRWKEPSRDEVAPQLRRLADPSSPELGSRPSFLPTPPAHDSSIRDVAANTPRAPMLALHDYKPQSKRTGLVAASFIALAVVVLGGASWVFYQRNPQILHPPARASRPTSSTSSHGGPAPSGSSAAPPDSTAPVDSSISVSPDDAVRGSEKDVSSTSKASTTPSTATTVAVVDEPPPTPREVPTPRPKPKRSSPREVAPHNNAGGEPSPTPKGGTAPAETPTSSILDKRK